MGGSSKPADPKVTPFQEPAPPTNPIPNFFGAREQGGYKPNTGASEQAFTMPQQASAQPVAQPQQSAMETPWQAPQQPMQAPEQGMGYQGGGMGQQGDYTPFSIPSRRMRPGGQGNGVFGGGMLGQQFGQSLPPELLQMLRQYMGGATRGAPRYQNYTDTNPAESTNAQGFAMFNPNDWRA